MSIPSSDNIALGSSYSNVISHDDKLDTVSFVGVTGRIFFFG
jgi:hypothetical protein